MLQPTFFGVQPLSQQYERFLSVSEGGTDYMTSVSEYMSIQNGAVSSRQLAFDSTFRFLYDQMMGKHFQMLADLSIRILPARMG